MNLALFGTVFAVIFIAELPDKTMIATLVMGSRSDPRAVWLGAGSAFITHVALACVAGRLILLLPHTLVLIFETVLFLGGALYLLFIPEKAEVAVGEEAAQHEKMGSFLRVSASAFAVIFIGEFGDLTQLLILNFVAKSHNVLTVFIAASFALVTIAGIAALSGRALMKVLPLAVIRKAGGVVLAGFGIYSLVTIFVH
jgi:putative Ca2+/H+ antiporter (TMEM165/GDT1 family)